MQMSNDEIVRSFKNAEKPREQVSVPAQLNGCSEEKIRAILSEGGIDGRQLPRKKTVQKGKPQGKSGTILSVMRDEERRLVEQKNVLPERIRALQEELEALDGKLEALRKAEKLIGEAFG